MSDFGKEEDTYSRGKNIIDDDNFSLERCTDHITTLPVLYNRRHGQ